MIDSPSTSSNVGTALLPKQRQMEILAKLEGSGSVRVTSLAKLFQVAEETIRRDLEKLGAAGLLTRTHGGAVRAEPDHTDLPIGIRRSTNAPQKQQIARQAVELVEPEDILGLDASTTALELAYQLPDLPLTVVTNGLDVARVLADRSSVRVVVAGGELDAVSMCTVGPVAEADVRRFAINKAFLSCKGVDLDRGYSEASTAHAAIKRTFVESASETHLLVDHTKLGVASMAFFAAIDDVHQVITDDAVNAAAVQVLRSAGVTLTVANKRV